MIYVYNTWRVMFETNYLIADIFQLFKFSHIEFDYIYSSKTQSEV